MKVARAVWTYTKSERIVRDGEVVTDDEELATALAGDASVIILDGEFDLVVVERSGVTLMGKEGAIVNGVVVLANDVVIRNVESGTLKRINIPGKVTGVGGGTAFYLNGTGILLDNVTADGLGTAEPTTRMVVAEAGSEFTVKNSVFSNGTTGIFAHSPLSNTTRSIFSSIDNKFINFVAGIGAIQYTEVDVVEGNSFKNCQEGIGIGTGAGDSDGKLVEYLENNNEFEDCTDNVKDYRS